MVLYVSGIHLVAPSIKLTIPLAIARIHSYILVIFQCNALVAILSAMTTLFELTRSGENLSGLKSAKC